MKKDTFVKVTMVLIALFLGIIALRPFFEIGSASANPGGKFDYIQVWCSSCSFPGLPREGHFIILDSRNGNIWVYSDKAMAGQANPLLYGKLNEIGQPILRTKL